jgi:Dual-action HEIGH metallo-peptidase
MQKLLALCLFLFTFACESRITTVENQPSPGNNSQPLSRAKALADIRDVPDFARQLEAIQNPHILVSGRYASRDSNDIKIQANALRAAIWDSPQLGTCWENPVPAFATQMANVQQAIADTWQRASKLRFTGWQQCPPISETNQQVIRIQIDDSGPRTLGLGKQLNAIQHGMLLNFTFLRWSPTCQTMTDYCIKAIAVHEFGHAIGFAHEQNRADAPGECQQLAQGTDGDVLLTPYDARSVMNYCNMRYNNDGQLSALDKEAVQRLYGIP